MQVPTRRFLLYFKKIDKTTDQFSKLTFSSRLLDPWNYGGRGGGVSKKNLNTSPRLSFYRLLPKYVSSSWTST